MIRQKVFMHEIFVIFSLCKIRLARKNITKKSKNKNANDCIDVFSL